MTVLHNDYKDWRKQASTHEAVDYEAVTKAFLDQAYGIVANKAKILFQDPFRLGFEIIKRNEKATRMVGNFSFRVNKQLLFVPVFFVNGEIKPADMIYRVNIKRFIPLTEDWCAYLVRGVQERSGETVDKNRFRQADAYMDRLAYPQQTKYASMRPATNDELVDNIIKAASHEIPDRPGDDPGLILEMVDYIGGQPFSKEAAAQLEDSEDLRLALHMSIESEINNRDAAVKEIAKQASSGEIWSEYMAACARDDEPRKLLPELIDAEGPSVLNKIASWCEGERGVEVERVLAEYYTEEELNRGNGWLSKQASNEEFHGIKLINDPLLAKSASARSSVFDRGFSLEDTRPEGSYNVVIEEVNDGSLGVLRSTGPVHLLRHDGNMEKAVLMTRNRSLLDDCELDVAPTLDGTPGGSPDVIYFPGDKTCKDAFSMDEIFGDPIVTDEKLDNIDAIKPTEAVTGKCYIAVAPQQHVCSRPFMVESKSKEGDSDCIKICWSYGGGHSLYYIEGRESRGNYISDDIKFLEVATCDKPEYERDKFELKKCETPLMDSAGMNKWVRTGGSLSSSNEVTVKMDKSRDVFDIKFKKDDVINKSASQLSELEANLLLAEEGLIHCDKAGEIIEHSKSASGEVRYRIFDTLQKSGFVTRAEGMRDWVTGFDPELQVRVDAPQEQILSTWTPKRQEQISRYGDVYKGPRGKNRSGVPEMLPEDTIFNKSPEDIAAMSRQYDMPQIWDHGCVGQLSQDRLNLTEQINQWVPDMESGLDRYFRVLFLLRYRPSEFEETYGKDALVEMEQDFAELAKSAGDLLLRTLQRFEINQYRPQED